MEYQHDCVNGQGESSWATEHIKNIMDNWTGCIRKQYTFTRLTIIVQKKKKIREALEKNKLKTFSFE